MTKRNQAIRRIQKPKALAEREAQNGNEHAAESAARIAAKLMLEHAIAQAEVEGPRDNDPLVTRSARTGKRLDWLRRLYEAVAVSSNCATTYFVGTDKVIFYGTESDCEIAEYLAAHLAREVQKRADKYMRELRASVDRRNLEAGPPRYRVAPRRRHNFTHSAVTELRERLRAMRREAVEKASASHGDAVVGNALVVLRNKLARAESFRDGCSSRAGRSSGYGYNSAGAEAGKGININEGLSGTSARSLPSG